MEHNSFDDQIFGDFGESLTPLGPKPMQAHHIAHHQQAAGGHSIHVMLGSGQDMCQTQTRLPECNTILPGSPSLREVYAPLEYGNCHKVSDYISINKLGCYSPTQKYDYKLDEYSPQPKLHSLDYHQNGSEQQHQQHQQHHHPHMQIYGHSPLHNNSSTTSTGGCDSERGTPQGPIDSNGINGTIQQQQNGSTTNSGGGNKKKDGDIIITTSSTNPSSVVASVASASVTSSSSSTSCSSSSNVNNSVVVVDQSSINSSNGNKKNDKNKKIDANGVKKKKTR